MMRVLIAMLALGCGGPADTDSPADTPPPPPPPGDDTAPPGPDFTIETKYGRELINYANVQKTNDVPKIWIEAAGIEAIPQSGPLPDGTLIVREEGDPQVNWVFFRLKQNGEWVQGNFFPDDPSFPFDLDPAGDQPCIVGCHGNPEERLFTIDILRRFVLSGAVEEPGCDQPGNTPCPESTYQ